MKTAIISMRRILVGLVPVLILIVSLVIVQIIINVHRFNDNDSIVTTTTTRELVGWWVSSWLFQSSYITTGTVMPNFGKTTNDNKKVGITFSRQIIEIPDGASVQLNFIDDNKNTNTTTLIKSSSSSHCIDTDIYGNNNCYYNWGDIISFRVDADIGNVPIVANDYFIGHLLIDTIIPYKIICPLCGQDCIIRIPLIKDPFIIPMLSACPITDTTPISQVFTQKIRTDCPIHTIPQTSISGTINIIQNLTGTTIGTATFNLHIKC